MSVSGPSAVYYFRAGVPEGGVFKGELQASSAQDALEQLRHKGFTPLRLEPTPIREPWWSREIVVAASTRLTAQDCEAFCRELALLLGSAIPVTDAIAIMLPSLKRGSRLARFAAAVRQGLRLGRSLSNAIENSGFDAPSDFLPVIRAGEDSGSLTTALTLLRDGYADANRFARSYSAALAYPALLLGVSVLVFGLIAFFVAPNLARLFTSMNRPVPMAISVLSGGAAFLGANLLPLAVGGTVLAALIGAGGASRSVKRLLKSALFRLPVVGGAMRWSASRRFAATLRLYLTSNVPIASALPNALTSAGFPAGSHKVRRLTERVREGAKLSLALQSHDLLPPKLVHLIAVGESGGRLPEVLATIVAEAKNRFEQRMSLVSTLLAPVLILVVGSLIGTVIFSVFSALLDINEVAL